KGQLGSPLGLGHPFPSVPGPRSPGADFYIRTVIAHLRAGLLYYYNFTEFPPEDDASGRKGGEFGPLTHMFPFTPVELHSGWILGKERLITCVSGRFPWPYERRPRVTQYDSRGRMRTANATVARVGSGWRITIQLRDWWEVAVIE